MLIAIIRQGGGVSIMRILSEETDLDKEVLKWESSSGEKAFSAHEISEDEIPKFREFRNAWAWRGGTIDYDMVKAREIHLEGIRKLRDAWLATLDLQYMRADEANDKLKKAEIAREKQRLRDLPQTIRADLDSAETIEQLKLIKPLV